MKVSGGLREHDVVVGNVYNKYDSRNPLVRRLMRGFESSLDTLVGRVSPGAIHEVGCGEGYWVIKWKKNGLDARGTDFSARAIELARQNALSSGIPPGVFEVRDIHDLRPDRDGADLVVCCEVLEHLPHPEKALENLRGIARKNIILSVPREPLWRVLNLARGKYFGQLGNTPGHVRHWSRKSFLSLVGKYFEVQAVLTPVPWTIALCRARPGAAPGGGHR